MSEIGESANAKTRRLAVWLAASFGVLSMVLGALVVAQAVELHRQGWRMAMGTFPEWMAGFGTIFTALAAVAAYLAFRVAAAERRSLEAERQAVDQERRALAEIREAERQDNLINQARLIVVDQVQAGLLAVVNHSAAPIFNLAVQHLSPVDSKVSLSSPVDHHALIGRTVVPPGGASDAIRMRIFQNASAESRRGGFAQHVSFTFTDARGARWKRVGNQQPIRLLDQGQTEELPADPAPPGL